MQGTITNIVNLIGGRQQLIIEGSLTINEKNDISQFKAALEVVDVSIKKYRKKRSLSANSLLWTLLDKLADKLQTTKIELYRDCIRQVGKFQDMQLPTKAIKEFTRLVCAGSEGTQVEIMWESDTEGYSIIRLYLGSSGYNQKEFSRLLNYIIDECQEQGIDTETPEEIDRLIKMIKE